MHNIPISSKFLILNGFYLENDRLISLYKLKKPHVLRYLTNAWEYYDPEDACELLETAIRRNQIDLTKYLLTHKHNAEGLIRQIPENEFETIFPYILKHVPEYISENIAIIKDRCQSHPEFLKDLIATLPVPKTEPLPEPGTERRPEPGIEKAQDLTLAFDLKKQKDGTSSATEETPTSPRSRPNTS